MMLNIVEFRPPRIAMSLLCLAGLAQWMLPELSIMAPRPLAGIIISLAGFLVMIQAWRQFRAAGTAVCPTATATRLVTGGIFRLSRNPMYLGMIGMLVGVAVTVGTLPFYLVVLLYFLVINFSFCPYEERKLLAAFGEEYRTYMNRVRRWL